MNIFKIKRGNWNLKDNYKVMKQLFTTLFVIGAVLSTFASRVDTLNVKSRSMNKSIANLVILPDSYAVNKQNFPVLYLLHGAGGDYTDWVTRVSAIKEYADSYNMIIVCPDGGRTSWYLDSPVDLAMRYETYVSEELVQAVDKKYNTMENRNSRAITGLSMGGHGAFYLAFKHQEVWGAAGSMSGGLDIRPFPENWDLAKRLGQYAENWGHWEENTVINMVHLLKKDHLKLIFDCGINDFFYDANKRMHQKLMERNIPHDYIERPGSHNWEYWANAIQYQLLFFDNFFKS
ncbi:alpha/beta hydrolase family protein [Arenibacter sp. ARW7G5Y1]|uniref:alpha/beta hydrolase n=1 Tax=Arenibacter sp. ARW7G5Y1 TaxID=2135619 RepID=UPI000D89663E|nr:alpha/beta hydrolase family protein [Arenibacter sp. ARW7G5Y1]PXX29106.1 S-formylglutathione hydrolase FrmB [Arenibacter sp. ARW7G5Y1]|tara:strand:+ start:11194 stop:12063 length:870 start_codon:yes stop_codon:yes gene_type:complete